MLTLWRILQDILGIFLSTEMTAIAMKRHKRPRVFIFLTTSWRCSQTMQRRANTQRFDVPVILEESGESLSTVCKAGTDALSSWHLPLLLAVPVPGLTFKELLRASFPFPEERCRLPKRKKMESWSRTSLTSRAIISSTSTEKTRTCSHDCVALEVVNQVIWQRYWRRRFLSFQLCLFSRAS